MRNSARFDAAANPMYASFANTSDLTPYTHLKPTIDIDEKNTATACGTRESARILHVGQVPPPVEPGV